MATTIDTLAEKQRKQKKVLIVLGVLMLAVVAFQGPKLWKQITGSTPAAAPATAEQEQAAAAASAAAATGGSVTTTVVAAGTTATPAAALAGVSVNASARPSPGPGQLRAFTLFQAKDPFVQSLPTETSGATSPTGEPTLSDTQPGKSGAKSGATEGATDGAKGSTTDSGTSGQSAPPEGAPQYATISVNSTPEPLAVKDLFPSPDKMFVLVSLKAKSAKIAVAGGAFTDGQTITLKMGKGLTLVNTATGARYALKLLYTGSAPEQVEEFSPGAKTEK